MEGLGSLGLHRAENIEDRLIDDEYSEMLQQALDRLSHQQRQVFTLARNEKLTYAEIAAKLNISPLTVKTHMSRALESIRQFFSDRGILLLVPACLIFL